MIINLAVNSVNLIPTKIKRANLWLIIVKSFKDF